LGIRRRQHADHDAEIERLTATVRLLRARVESLKATKGNLRRRVEVQEATLRELRKRHVAEQSLRPAAASLWSSKPAEKIPYEEIERASGIDYPRLLLRARGHARLMASEVRRIETELMTVSVDEVQALFPSDRVLSNFLLNLWEWGHGQTTLKSLPWNVSLPISDVCNARCSFCTSWFEGKRQLTLEQLERFEPVLRTAVYVGLVGHGEPLSHPRLGEIADRLAEYLDPRSGTYTITNGVYLSKWIDRFEQIRLASVSCSLNAATSETHHEVMGLPLGEFERIVETLQALAAGQLTSYSIDVSLTLVVTRQNIQEIPAFIELGNKIGATSMYLRTLLPQGRLVSGLNYHLLPAYLHPDFELHRANAIAAINASPVPVTAEPATWSNPVFPDALTRQIEVAPPTPISRDQVIRDSDSRVSRDMYYLSADRIMRGERSADPALADHLQDGTNPLNRHPPFRCRAVYNNLYVNELFLRVSPCCHLVHTPGHDEVRLKDMRDIVEAWNAPSFRDLRQHLAEGPLYGGCERCPERW
jgi:sulfatase maturation enzyme AslB (radical SAM superfamily)